MNSDSVADDSRFTNRAAGIAWAAASALLLLYLLLSDWAFEPLRDGFRLGAVSLAGAVVMLLSALSMTLDRYRNAVNPELAEIVRRSGVRYILPLCLSFGLFVWLLAQTGMLTAIGLYSMAVYWVFGVRGARPLAVATLATTVLVAGVFWLLSANLRLV